MRTTYPARVTPDARNALPPPGPVWVLPRTLKELTVKAKPVPAATGVGELADGGAGLAAAEEGLVGAEGARLEVGAPGPAARSPSFRASTTPTTAAASRTTSATRAPVRRVHVTDARYPAAGDRLRVLEEPCRDACAMIGA
jgi:hypothetical protein